jgi:hypothetical protein
LFHIYKKPAFLTQSLISIIIGKNTGQFVGYPITFYSFHPGGSIPLTTLVVANDSTRKLWMDKILEQTIPLSKNRAYLTKDINSAIKTI